MKLGKKTRKYKKKRENRKYKKRRALNTRERGQPQHQQPGHYNFTVSMNHTNGVKDVDKMDLPVYFPVQLQ
jgi:hypothetical protein